MFAKTAGSHGPYLQMTAGRFIAATEAVQVGNLSPSPGFFSGLSAPRLHPQGLWKKLWKALWITL